MTSSIQDADRAGNPRLIEQTIPVSGLLRRAVEEVPGWTPEDQLLALFTLALATSDVPGDILEIGSWCGRSAVALGLAARVARRGVVHCVDLFPEKGDWIQNPDGSWSIEVDIDGKRIRGYTEQTLWNEPYVRDVLPIYERFPGTLNAFNSAMKRFGLDELVRAHRRPPHQFLAGLSDDARFRLVYIDGEHSYASVTSDIQAAQRRLAPGGWICLDDAFVTYEGVSRAVRELIIDSGKYRLCQQLTRKFFVAQRR